MKNGFEPEGGYSYDLQVTPLDLGKGGEGGNVNIDMSLLGKPEAIDYGTHLYDDRIVQIQTQIGAENPRFAFNPNDPWRRVFEKGYLSDNLDGLRVLEVGTGSVLNLIKVAILFDVIEIIGSDLEKEVVELARKNFTQYCPEHLHKFQAIESNLLTQIDPKFLGEVNYIFGCIPQAIKMPGTPDNPDDSAHYYPGELFTQYEFNKYALGLNEALLHQITQVSKQATVLLNLAGRVGKDKLIELFKTHGFKKPEIKSEEIVPQCPSTSLDFYKNLEEKGYNGCEFYTDSSGSPQKKISATEAERIRKNEVEKYKSQGGDEGDLVNIGVFHSLQTFEANLKRTF